MASVNKVILVGHLGKDPETKTFENGGVVCSFTLATTDNYWDKEKNQRVDLPTEWHNIRISQSGLVKVAQQYLKKGSLVYLEGGLRTRQYEKDGVTKYFTEVSVQNMVMMSAKPEGAPTLAPNSVNETPYTSTPEDDLPF
ncbi:MAG: single-stranded DNA-binding protein [Flavobacteriales bacterium]